MFSVVDTCAWPRRPATVVAGWQTMLPQKHREPRRNFVGVKRLAVGFGKQQIILDALAALYGNFPLPVCTDFQPFPHLPLLIVFQ